MPKCLPLNKIKFIIQNLWQEFDSFLSEKRGHIDPIRCTDISQCESYHTKLKVKSNCRKKQKSQ